MPRSTPSRRSGIRKVRDFAPQLAWDFHLVGRIEENCLFDQVESYSPRPRPITEPGSGAAPGGELRSAQQRTLE